MGTGVEVVKGEVPGKGIGIVVDADLEIETDFETDEEALLEPPVPVSVIGIETVLFRGVAVTARVLTPGFTTVGAELILLTPPPSAIMVFTAHSPLGSQKFTGSFWTYRYRFKDRGSWAAPRRTSFWLKRFISGA